MQHRRDDIDVYRGFLVWLVVISHIMALSKMLSNSYIFSIITRIHMPLFMGLSGFLYSQGAIVHRHTVIKRLVLPWLIANFVYLLLPGSSFSVQGLFLDLLRTYGIFLA